MNKYQRLLSVLTLTFCLLLPALALAAPGSPIPDMPTGYPAGIAYRPVYINQLGTLAHREQTASSLSAEEFEHRVARGETLGAIAKKYGTSVEYLLRVNNISNPHFIREGQILTLLTEDALSGTDVAYVVHTIRRGETVWGLSRRYGVDMEEILTANNIADPTRMRPGLELSIPGVMAHTTTPGALPQRETVVASRLATRNARFVWPTQGYISSGYGPRWGRFHYGIDIAANTGTPIVAVAAGIVIDAGWRRGYGYMIRIDHQNGWESVYGHASRLFVSRRQSVRSGEKIAAVGQTGNATGPHVHLEMIFQGKHQNPLKYLPSR